MAPQLNFIAGGGSFPINYLSGSGLGFYGSATFGASVAVGNYQQRTFITDATGSIKGPEVNNVQYLNPGSGILGQAGSGIGLQSIPNWQATLHVQFTNDAPVRTQNAFAMIFDRTNTENPASGVTTKIAEMIHPNPVQGPGGSGDSTWWSFNYATGGLMMPLTDSPGLSGLSPNGLSTSDSTHDWYISISASPDSIGSKNLYGLYVSVEYL